MRVAIVWREESDYGHTIESYDPDSPEGESLCRTYDIVEYPTIIALNDDGKMLQEWRGTMLPKIDDVDYYLI